MSESEKFEAQGRAHARLKDLTSEIATTASELQRLNRELSDISKLIETFISNPRMGQHDMGISAPNHVENRLRRLEEEKMIALVHDLFRKTVEIAELREQVSKF